LFRAGPGARGELSENPVFRSKWLSTDLRDTIVGGRMLFGQAVEQFREFLRTQGHSGPLMWIGPRDVAFWFGELLIRPRGGTEIHAEKLFNQAFQRGFGVSIEGIAKLDQRICCFVFAPDDAEDAATNFVVPPLTMKVRQELKTAREPGSVLWWLAGRLSSKRARSQALQFFGHDLDRRSGTANV